MSGNHSIEVGGGIIAAADMTAVNSGLFDNTADLAISEGSAATVSKPQELSVKKWPPSKLPE